MTEAPLFEVRLPFNMSSGLAKDLSLLLTDHSRETDLVRYLALALHYCSWTTNQDATLSRYQARLASLSPDSSFQLLELLTLPTAHALQGLHNDAPRAQVRMAQKAAGEWRRALEDRNVDVLRLHHRALDVLDKWRMEAVEVQRGLADEVRMIVGQRHPEVRLRETALRDKAPVAPTAPVAPAGPARDSDGGSAGDGQLFTPAQTLHLLFSQMGMTGRMIARIQEARAAASATEGRPEAAPGPASSAVEPDPTRPALKLFNPATAAAALQRLPAAMPGEGNAQQRRLLDTMANDSGWRTLTETGENPLASLYVRFPHFKEVLDFVAGSLALAACGEDGRVARIAPLLLRGEPGCGKTYFAQELAKALGTFFVERDLSVTSEAFVLSGMDSGWKNSKPGVVFDALVHGRSANPVICLNEVDKAKPTSAHSSPMAPLYALLEPTSAERFVDEFVPVELDASRVIWVLTANDGDIPEPILSRLEIFDIQNPSAEQCKAIAQSVWASLCQKALPKGHGFPELLPESVLDVMQSLSPRVMRKALTSAASRSVMDGRKELAAQDLLAGGSRYQPASVRRPIGFCPSV